MMDEVHPYALATLITMLCALSIAIAAMIISITSFSLVVKS